MPREVVVACENRRSAVKAARAKNVYDTAVSAAVRRAGVSKETIDWEYVEQIRRTGVDARTAAALAIKKPHTVVGVAAEEDRSALGEDDPPHGQRGVYHKVFGKDRELHDCDCGPYRAAHPDLFPPTADGFSKVIKDPVKWAAVLARAKAVGPLDNDRQLYRFIRPDLENLDQEVFLVVGLDAHNGLRTVSEVASGQRDRVAVDAADVLRIVLIEGCKAFVVAHNHPAGRSVVPSESDKKLTAQLEDAARSNNVIFLDHLVIGHQQYYSFRDKKTKRA